MEDIILKMVYYIIYVPELFLVGDILFHNRVKKKIRYVIFTFLYLAVMVPVILFAEDALLLIEIILYAFLFVFLFEGKILSQLARFLAVYLYTVIVEGVVTVTGFFILKNLHIMELWSGGLGAFLGILSVLPVFFIISRKCIQKYLGYFRTLSWSQYVAIATIAFGSIFLLLFCNLTLEKNNSEIAVIQFVVTIILLVTIFIGIIWLVTSVYGKDYYQKQNCLKDEIIQLQQRYYQNMIDSNKQMRNYRHDIRSQLGCLQLLVSEGKTEQAMEYLEKMELHLNQTALKKYHTGNEILDVVLSQSCAEAAEKGVDVKVTGTLNQVDFMDSYDLCTIFSNAIHNAVEACEQIPQEEQTVQVLLMKHQKTVFFRFINPAAPEMYENVKKGRTGKEDRKQHGFGMENIYSAVERNEGEMRYHFEKGKMVLEIFFYD